MGDWGNTVAKGTSQFKIRVRAGQSDSADHSDFTGYVDVATKYAIHDSSNSLTTSGAASSSGAVSIYTTVSSGAGWSDSNIVWNARQVSWSASRRYPHLGGAYTQTLYAALSGIDVAPGTANASETVTVPARAYSAPAAVTGLTATRVSDNRVDVGWTNHSTDAGYYQSLRLHRRTDGGGWVQIATLAGTATGYVDTTVNGNHYYDYGIHAINSAGDTNEDTPSPVVYMTPATPTNVTAEKTGTTSVTVTATDASNTESAFEWQRTADSGLTWDTIGTTSAGVPTYTDSSAPGGTVSYRVRATRDALVSAWSVVSNSVTTIAPPAAPTISNWANYIATGSDVLPVAWQHNTLDGSAQREAEVVYKIGSAAEVTATVTGTAGTYNIPTAGVASGTAITAKVRTYGLHATPGPYSAVVATTLVAAPQVTIVVPATDAAVISDLPLVVAWSETDASGHGQAAWEMRLYAAGALVYTASGTTQMICYLAAVTYLLADDTTYSITIDVRSSTGLTTSATRTFSTEYAAPAPPVIYASLDPDTLAVFVMAYVGEDAELPETESISVMRVETYHGATETSLLADGIAAGATVVDHTPRLGADVVYRATASAANGAYSVADTVVSTVAEGSYALNFGDDYADVTIISYDTSLSDEADDDSEEMLFAGRDDPVLYPGEHKITKLTLSGNVFGVDGYDAVCALKAWSGRRIIFRNPYGLRHPVHAKVSLSQETGPLKTGVSIAMTVVE